MFNTSMLANFEGDLRRISYAATKLSCSEDHIVTLVDEGEIEFIDIASKGAKRRELRFTDVQLDDFAVSRTRKVVPVEPPMRARKTKSCSVGQSDGSFASQFRAKHSD